MVSWSVEQVQQRERCEVRWGSVKVVEVADAV